MKIGRLIDGWNSQVPLPPLNSPDSSVLALPARAVRPMLGKNAARAAPMSALAALSWCSAARMSGRRCSRSEGRPTGSSASCTCSSGAAAGRSAGSALPSSSCRALWSWASSRWYWATLTRAPSTALRDWLSSSAEATPTSKLRWVSARLCS